jgi:hypothetical protein
MLFRGISSAKELANGIHWDRLQITGNHRLVGMAIDIQNWTPNAFFINSLLSSLLKRFQRCFHLMPGKLVLIDPGLLIEIVVSWESTEFQPLCLIVVAVFVPLWV